MEDEIENQMNKCKSMKDLYSNILANKQLLNQKLEDKDEIVNSNKMLKTEINRKDKELSKILMKFQKIRNLHKDVLLKIKEYDHEKDKIY